MKFTLGLIAILAIMGLGQANPFMDVGQNSAIEFSKSSDLTEALQAHPFLYFGANNDLQEELLDFVQLLPIEFFETLIKYIQEDKKVQEAIIFMFTTEFHDVLRALEALKEHQAIVVYLEKAGLPVIQAIQELHRIIGMEEYVPPKIEDFFKSLIKTQEIGDGMEGLIKDLYDILPSDKIDALYEEKMKTSKVYADFIAKITSEELAKIGKDLIAQEAYKEFITKTKEKGLEVEEIAKLNARIIGLK